MNARTVAFAMLLATCAAAQEGPARAELTGRVTGADAGERVRVTVWHNDMGRHHCEPLAEALTAADGTFACRDVAWFRRQEWGSNTVVVAARGRRGAALLELRGEQAVTTGLELALAAPLDLQGTVRDDAGAPLAGVRVWPAIFGDPAQHAIWVTEPLLPWLAQSDALGHFVIRGVPAFATYRLRTGHDDYATSWVEVAEPAAAIQIALAPGGRLAGRVLRPDGTPAVRCEVAAAARGSGYGYTLTDEHGAFEITGLPADEYEVWAEAKDLTVVACTGIKVLAGDRIEALTVRLVHGGFIVGRIVDTKTGKPITPGPWTDVAMYGPARHGSGACECTPVQADGTFKIRAPAGKNRIYLRAALGYSEPDETVDVVEGEETKVEWRVTRKAREE